MTTILAAAAVVLFAILIAVCLFGLCVYQQEKRNEKKDEIKAQPGPYSNIADYDVQSMHPSPFSYKYSGGFKKDSRPGSAYTNYSSYADRVNQVIPNTTPYELRNISSRISELENKLDGIEEALEIGDYKNNDGEMITTIPEDIQNLRNEVETLTRSVNDIKTKQDDFIRLVGDLQEKQDCLTNYYRSVRQIAGIAYDKVKTVETKITVGDDPNEMSSTTTSEVSND